MAWTIGVVMAGMAGLGSMPDRATAQERAPAKQAAMAEQRLERAILLLEVERDPEGGIAALREIADDTAVPKEVRASATIRLFRALRDADRLPEANQLLRWALASRLIDERAAADAQRDRAADERLGERVNHAIDALLEAARKDPRTTTPKSPGFDDLVWIGEPAVPHLTEYVIRHANDLDAVETLTAVITMIGGTNAAGYFDRILESNDPLLQRSVIKGALHRNSREEPLRSRVRRLARSPDAQVRRDAVAKLGDVLDTQELATFLDDPAREVRIAALLQFGTIRSFAGPREDLGPVAAKLEATLRSALNDPDESTRAAAAAVLGADAFLRSDVAVDLYLRILDDAAEHPEWPLDWTRGAFALSKTTLSLDPDRVMPALLRIAGEWGPFEVVEGGQTYRDDRGPLVRFAIESFLEALMISPEARFRGRRVDRDPWRDRPRDEPYELLSLNVGGSLYQWLNPFARPEDLLLLATAIHRTDQPSHLAFIVELAPKSDEATRAEAARILSADVERRSVELAREGVDGSDLQGLQSVIHFVQSLRVRGTGDAIVRAVSRFPELWSRAVPTNRDAAESFTDADLVALMTLPIEAGSQSQASDLPAGRSAIFELLVARGSEAGALALPRLYERLSPLAKHHNPLLTLLARGERGIPSDISSEAVARALSETFDLHPAPAWSDATKLVRSLDHEVKRNATSADVHDPRVKAAVQVLLARLKECPSAEEREIIAATIAKDFAAEFPDFIERALLDETLRDDVIGRLRNAPIERLRPAFESSLADEDPATVVHAIRFVASFRDERAAKSLLPMLAHEDSGVRRKVVESLPDLPVPQAWELAVEQLRDVSATVRNAACQALGRLVEPRAVPALVEMLRDESVRDEAKAALEKIQFYVDQKSRWDKLSAAGGLDATSAAAALLKQAAAGQPKDSRLAAIASLGTLGVAETLPMLIEWMADADRDVAAAAKDAVARINAKAARESSASKKEGDAKEP